MDIKYWNQIKIIILDPYPTGIKTITFYVIKTMLPRKSVLSTFEPEIHGVSSNVKLYITIII